MPLPLVPLGFVLLGKLLKALHILHLVLGGLIFVSRLPILRRFRWLRRVIHWLERAEGGVSKATGWADTAMKWTMISLGIVVTLVVLCIGGLAWVIITQVLKLTHG